MQNLKPQEIKALVEATKGLDRFARLLATENITVEHSPTATASFDLKRRLLTLPMWSGMEEPVYHMLSLHEVGHALFTPTDGWSKIIDPSEDKLLRHYVNVIEDARIDRRMKAKFPGGRHDYDFSAKYLVEQDFFGIKDRSLDSLSFIDRLNVHFKVGQEVTAPFDDDESKFLLRIETTSSFDDVVDLAREILQFAKDRRDEITQGEGGDIEMMFDFDGDGDGDGDGDEGEAGDATGGRYGDRGGLNRVDIGSTTQDNFEKMLMRKHVDPKKTKGMDYINVPEVKDYSSFIIKHDVLLQALDESLTRIGSVSASMYSNKMNERFKEFVTFNTKAVSYMVKEFELKKAAAAYARAKDSKTGIINPNKVHSYKYSEDIFRRLTTLPNGKSHGMVMFIDFSGSMQSNMLGTIQQLISLVEFCRKTGISHRVYGFTTGVGRTLRRNKIHVSISKEPGDVTFSSAQFDLLELFNDRMNRSTYTSMARHLHEFGVAMGERRSWHQQKDDEWIFQNDVIGLGSTPLNQTIVLAHKIIQDFRSETKPDVVHTVFLTDGESDGLEYNSRHHWNPIIMRDHRTKHQAFVDGSTEQTEFLIRNLRSQQNVNAAVFRIVNGVSELSRMKQGIDTAAMTGKLRKDKHLVLPGVLGATQFFAVLGGKNLNVEDTELEDFGGVAVTTNKLAKAFVKASNKRAASRTMLVKFIDMIAGHATKVAIDKR